MDSVVLPGGEDACAQQCVAFLLSGLLAAAKSERATGYGDVASIDDAYAYGDEERLQHRRHIRSKRRDGETGECTRGEVGGRDLKLDARDGEVGDVVQHDDAVGKLRFVAGECLDGDAACLARLQGNVGMRRGEAQRGRERVRSGAEADCGWGVEVQILIEDALQRVVVGNVAGV